MRASSLSILRFVASIPVGFVVSLLLSYVYFGITWEIDRTMMHLPWEGFQWFATIPLRLLAFGAAISCGYCGEVAAGLIGPPPKLASIIVSAIPITAYFVAYVVATLMSAPLVDIFEMLAVIGLPIGGVIGIPFAAAMVKRMDERALLGRRAGSH